MKVWRCKQCSLKGISFSFLFSITHLDHFLIQRWCQKGNHFPHVLLQVKCRRASACWSTLELAALAWQPFSWWDWQTPFPSPQRELKRNWKPQQAPEQPWGSTTRLKILVKRSWPSPKVRTSTCKDAVGVEECAPPNICTHTPCQLSPWSVKDQAVVTFLVQPNTLFTPRMWGFSVWLHYFLHGLWVCVRLGHKYCACVIVASTRNRGTKSSCWSV